MKFLKLTGLSLGITTACALINLVTAWMGRPLLALSFSGGEVISYAGFGVIYEKFYPLVSLEEAAARTYKDHAISFDIRIFLLCWAVVFVITMIVALVQYIKARKNHTME